jgi:hypothetical protein
MAIVWLACISTDTTASADAAGFRPLYAQLEIGSCSRFVEFVAFSMVNPVLNGGNMLFAALFHHLLAWLEARFLSGAGLKANASPPGGLRMPGAPLSLFVSPAKPLSADRMTF